MATKYEETLIPHLTYFAKSLSDCYKVTKEDILNLESRLMFLLNFNFGYVSPLLYISHFHIAGTLE